MESLYKEILAYVKPLLKHIQMYAVLLFVKVDREGHLCLFCYILFAWRLTPFSPHFGHISAVGSHTGFP